MKTIENTSERCNPEKRNAKLHKGIRRRPILQGDLGQAPTQLRSRPNQEPTCQRRWRGRPPMVQPHQGCARTPMPPLRPTFGRAVTLMLRRLVCQVS